MSNLNSVEKYDVAESSNTTISSPVAKVSSKFLCFFMLATRPKTATMPPQNPATTHKYGTNYCMQRCEQSRNILQNNFIRFRKFRNTGHGCKSCRQSHNLGSAVIKADTYHVHSTISCIFIVIFNMMSPPCKARIKS